VEPDGASPEPVAPQERAAAVASASAEASSVVEQRAKPVEAPEVVASEKPKPAPVHIEAAVTFSAGAGEAKRDWSDFDPEAWEEGQPCPEHLYRAVQNQDRDYYLVPNTEMDEAAEPIVTPEIQALRDRCREIEQAEEELFEKFGRNRMLWTDEVIAETRRLDQEVTDIEIELRKALAAR